MFHALTGDETGLIKLLDLHEKTVLYNTYKDIGSSSSRSDSSQQSRAHGCKSMTWCDPTGNDTEFASILRANSVVEFYKLPDPTTLLSSSASATEDEQAALTVQLLSSLHLPDFESPQECFPMGSGQHKRLHLCYGKKGQVVLAESDEEYTKCKESSRFLGRNSIQMQTCVQIHFLPL